MSKLCERKANAIYLLLWHASTWKAKEKIRTGKIRVITNESGNIKINSEGAVKIIPVALFPTYCSGHIKLKHTHIHTHMQIAWPHHCLPCTDWTIVGVAVSCLPTVDFPINRRPIFFGFSFSLYFHVLFGLLCVCVYADIMIYAFFPFLQQLKTESVAQSKCCNMASPVSQPSSGPLRRINAQTSQWTRG